MRPEPGPEALKKRSEPSEVTPIHFNFTIATPNPDFNSKALLFSRSCFTAASDVSYLLLYILNKMIALNWALEGLDISECLQG